MKNLKVGGWGARALEGVIRALSSGWNCHRQFCCYRMLFCKYQIAIFFDFAPISGLWNIKYKKFQYFLRKGFPRTLPLLYFLARVTSLACQLESCKAKKAERFKTEDMERGLNSLGGSLLKESDCCPSLWSSFLLPILADSSRVWISAKGKRAFLAKRSNCGHDGPKQEGSILQGNRATKCQNWCCRIYITSASSH